MVVRNSGALDGLMDVLVVVIVIASIVVMCFNNMQFIWAVTSNATATTSILLITLITIVIGYKVATVQSPIGKGILSIILIVLIGLEWFNGTGFSQQRMAATKEDAIKESPQYKELTSKVTEAEAAVQQLSASNTPEASSAGATVIALQESINSKKQSMNALPANRKTQRSAIAAEIADKQTELAAVSGLAAGFEAYQAAVDKRDEVAKELANLTASASNVVATGIAELDAIFVNLAERLGTTATVIQTYWNSLTNIVLTLISVFGLALLTNEHPQQQSGRIIDRTASGDYQVSIANPNQFEEMRQQLAFLTSELGKLSNPALVNASGAHADGPKT